MLWPKRANALFSNSDLDCDVACLLNTRLDDGSEHKFAYIWDRESHFAHGANCQSAGKAFLTWHGVEVEDFFTNSDGRYAAIKVSLANSKLLIVAIYAPACLLERGRNFSIRFY